MDNRESKILYASEYNKQHKEERKEYMRKYNIKNKERIKLNRDKWNKNNLSKKRKLDLEYGRKRRAIKLAVKENYSAADEEITRVLFNNKCFKCKSNSKLQVDHHKPLSKGYPLTVINAVILCKSCNSSKHNKMPEDFYSNIELEEIGEIFIKAERAKRGDD